MKKFLAVLTLACLLTGCAAGAAGGNVYEATFLTLFDTVTTIRGRAESQAAFTEAAQGVHDTLLHYHQLFDIYNDYAGCNNLKTVNDQAGVAPVEVDGDIIRLLNAGNFTTPPAARSTSPWAAFWRCGTTPGRRGLTTR